MRSGWLDLFDGRPQLVMHHFMYGPDWDAGCSSCSSAADRLASAAPAARPQHLAGGGVSGGVRDPGGATSARMGWDFPWYSSYGSDFNYDFHTHPSR